MHAAMMTILILFVVLALPPPQVNSLVNRLKQGMKRSAVVAALFSEPGRITFCTYFFVITNYCPTVLSQYIWEQQEFDVINRTTRISLHFQLGKKKTLRHAFSYNWRL